MKQLILALLIVFVPSIFNAQNINIVAGAGYNASFPNPIVFNKIIDSYNEDRPYFSKEMKHLNYLDGMNFTAHLLSDYIHADFSIVGRSSVLKSEWESEAGTSQHYLKVNARTFNLGMGVNLSQVNPFISLGVSADFGAFIVESKWGLKSNFSEYEYSKIFDPLILGGSIWTQFIVCTNDSGGFGILLRPYYHFDFSTTNYQWLNEELNPLTYQNDTFDHYTRMNYFGVMLMAVVVVPIEQ
jgi:hypothetical protein